MSASTFLKQQAQSRGLLTFLLILLTAVNWYASRPPKSHDLEYRNERPNSLSYDPRIWPIAGIRPATLTPEESVHYKIETMVGEAEWKSSLPQGKGIIYLNATSSAQKPIPHRVAVFHQIECLDVVREEMMKRRASPEVPASARAHFCLNYLKHSVLCHADSHLEMVRSEYGGRAVLPYTERTDCVDWEAVWTAAEDNFRAHRGVKLNI